MVLSAKDLDHNSREDQIESAAPCHDTLVMELSLFWLQSQKHHGDVMFFHGDVLFFKGIVFTFKLSLLKVQIFLLQEPIEHGYYYALGLLLSTLIGALLNAQFNYQVRHN